jgi:hypothetical protein
MNRINPKRLGRAGSLDTPSIVRRKPSLAQDIMRRNRRNAAPTRNQWSGADIEFNWKGGLVLALAVVIAVGIALRIAGVL